MTATTRVLLLLTLFVGALFAACDRGETPAPTEVPKTWSDARTTPGHVAHLGKKAEDGHVIACADCHVEKEGFKSPGAEPCAKCHEEKTKRHHKGNDKKPTTCITCHSFSMKETGPGAPTCIDCHANEKKHHGTADASCTSCHAPHGEPKSVNADCTSCHTGVTAQHGMAKIVGTTDAGTITSPDAAGAELRDGGVTTNSKMCSTCHAPHTGKAEAKDTCATCHSKTSPIVTQKGHPACTTCHTPHDAKASNVPTCASCHAPKTSVGLNKGHANCTSCHAPHAPLGAAGACESCHKNHEALAASKVVAHDKCTSCHDVHAPGTKPSCNKCHDKIAPKHPGFKSGPCNGCHAPHPATSTASIAASCTSCHSKIAPSDNKVHAGVTCGKCHQKHEFKSPSCATCHAKVASAVHSPGHDNCLGCHASQHNPVKQVDCGKCHSKEATTAPKGHAACASCHDSHAGKVTKTCGSCHAEKSKTQHSSLTCNTCHRPHGPAGVASPPSCTSCHTKLPGLHTMPTHQKNCQSCHGGHRPISSDRATCTSTCHENQRNHQPTATTCKGCHIFKNP